MLLLAELNLANEDFPAARTALGKLVEEEPDARVLTIMAAIERGEGASDDVVRGWLARALSAPRGPQWVCEKCNHIHTDWAPVCDNCQSFDTLSWTSPAMSEVSSTSALAMLPLIVAPKGATDTMDDEDDVEVLEAEIVDEDAAQNPDEA